jgi:hypothetical protein
MGSEPSTKPLRPAKNKRENPLGFNLEEDWRGSELAKLLSEMEKYSWRFYFRGGYARSTESKQRGARK